MNEPTWTITLNEYQRNNLLRHINSFGYPYGNIWHNKNLTDVVSVDTGDWFGEVALLLGGVLKENENTYGCRPASCNPPKSIDSLQMGEWGKTRTCKTCKAWGPYDSNEQPNINKTWGGCLIDYNETSSEHFCASWEKI